MTLSPKKGCPFNRCNKYKDFVNIFPGPNFVSPEWRCPLNRGAPKGRFQCRNQESNYSFFSSPFFLLPISFSPLLSLRKYDFRACRAQKACLLTLFHSNGCNFRQVGFNLEDSGLWERDWVHFQKNRLELLRPPLHICSK